MTQPQVPTRRNYHLMVIFLVVGGLAIERILCPSGNVIHGAVRSSLIGDAMRAPAADVAHTSVPSTANPGVPAANQRMSVVRGKGAAPSARPVPPPANVDMAQWGLGGNWSLQVDIKVVKANIPIATLVATHADAVTINYTLGPEPRTRFRAHPIVPKVSATTTCHGEWTYNPNGQYGICAGLDETHDNGSGFIAGARWHRQGACQ